MNDITIRYAEKNDSTEILNLLYDLERPLPKNASDVISFKNIIATYLNENDKTIIVAEQEILCGMVSIIFLPRLNQRFFEMYIPELIVRDSHRSKGVGTKLINFCNELAKEKKCHRIRLESGNLRKKSHNFYIKKGFEQSSLSFNKKIQ